MAQRPRYIERRGYAIALAWRVGLFLLATVGFPFATILIMRATNCASVGGACGAVALLSGLGLKPLIFLVFVGSTVAISMARIRELGLPGLIGLLVPALLMLDWQFGVMFGAHWSVGFTLGGPLGPPYYFLSAVLCMGFLCCIASRDDGESAAARFGIAGKLALAATVVILVLGAVRVGFFAWIMSIGLSGKPGTLSLTSTFTRIIAYSMLILPYAVLTQAVLFAYLLWQDRAANRGTHGPHGLADPPPASLAPTFGRRGG